MFRRVCPAAFALITLSSACASLELPADESTSDATAADSTTDPSGTSGAETTDTGSDLSGEELYVALCSSCHGPEAEGTALGYELRHPPREHARWVIRNGRSGTELAPSVMAPYAEGGLPDVDVDKIFDHLDSFPKPTTGEGLYLDYCGNCHGLDGRSGYSAVDIHLELIEAGEKVREGNGGTNYGARTEYMPHWTTAELSADDVAAIIAYVQTL